MKVLFVGSGFSGTARLQSALERAGFAMVGPAASTADLYRIMRELAPQAVIAAADSPARDCLEAVALASPQAPQLLLLPQAASDALGGAASGSFCLYVAPSVGRKSTGLLLEITAAHFRYQHSLRDLKPGRGEGVVDRAKRGLMERDGLSEDEAYHWLRRTAMARGARLKDLAQALVQQFDAGTEVAVATTN